MEIEELDKTGNLKPHTQNLVFLSHKGSSVVVLMPLGLYLVSFQMSASLPFINKALKLLHITLSNQAERGTHLSISLSVHMVFV